MYPTAVSTLPPALGHLQIAHWHNTISEITPSILAASEVAPEEFRIFISYKRSEAAELAEQLFEALSKEVFDVFLESASLFPPGLNFKTRLRQELADKAMLNPRTRGNRVGFASRLLTRENTALAAWHLLCPIPNQSGISFIENAH